MPTHQNWSTNNSIFRQMEQICNSNTNYMERILQVEDDTIGVNYRQEDAMEDTRRGPNPSTSFSARLDPNQQRQSRMEGNAPADYGHPHSHNNSDSQDNEEEINDKRNVHGTSTGKQTGNDVLLLVTAFTEMCRTIRFLRQSMPHQSLEPPPHFYYTENEAARHVNRHSNNEMTSPRDESTANQHQNHSSWNGNEQRIDPILNRRAIHCDTATVEEADVTIPRSQQGSDTSSTYKRSSNSEVKTALKAYDNTQNTSTPHNYYKQQQDEEEIDLFKANKEQDPPVESWNADRQNVQPIVNRATSATYSITSPKDRSSLSLFTSYPEQPTDQENNENRYETKNDNENVKQLDNVTRDRRSSLLNGRNLSTGSLKQKPAFSKQNKQDRVNTVVAQPHVFSGTAISTSLLSKSHLEKDMKANALILARFKGTHLPGDAAPSPTMTGTVNMANETARVEDELQADASYCGTDDCNYCPPNEMASMNSASATPNINHPPPLPEFFQSASMDLNTYLSLEEEGERQDDEYVDEDDGTSQNERDENSVELSHPSFFEGNIENRLSSTHRSFHMSSPIMSSVNELLTIVSPKQTATTLVDEGIDDMMAMSPPSQSVLMSSPRTSGIYPKAFPILSNVSALPDKVAYNDHYNDHDDYNDGLRISNSMAPPAEVSSLISLPADIANIYHQLGFSETLDPPPITPRILRAIRTTLNPEQNNNDARFWGICLLGFYGMFSVDELPDPIFRDAIGSPLPIRFRKNIATLNKPVIDNPDCNELSLYLVSLPVNKTSKPGSDHNASVLCPNKAIHEWLSIEECGPPRQLAQYLLAGAISPTSKQWMEQRLQQALEETDLDEFHDFHYRENYQLDSLRFGGAVCAYEAGVKVDNIRLVGGWNNYNTIAKFELDSLANNLASHVNRCCL